jgi:hypothetical protein
MLGSGEREQSRERCSSQKGRITLAAWHVEVWERVHSDIMHGISKAYSQLCRNLGKVPRTSCQPDPEIRIIAIAALPGAVESA